VHGSHSQWSEGIYENTFVKEDGVWKFKSLRYFPTFISDYDKGWAEDAQPVPTASNELPPDRPPTDVYEIFPKAHIPAYHYRNPVTGAEPQYPREQGRPSREAIRAATAPVERIGGSRAPSNAPEEALDAVVAEAERLVMRFKDYHELENLESAYGYYLDKNLWNDLADLFAAEGSMELAQRGIYKGNDRVRGFLLSVFGRGGEGPVEGRLGNHIQMQPVIHISPDGRSAKIRARMMQQLTFGERASMGASIYENEAVKENGVWKFSAVHAYNTWTAGYAEGWAKSQGGVPGPSADYPPDGPPTFQFAMFPTVYDMPFHYRNPVSGRIVGPTMTNSNKQRSRDVSVAPGERGGMPLDIAAEIRAIGARIEAQRTAEIYAPLQPKEPYSGVAVVRDLRYGPAERNVLDVFAPAPAGEAMPVVVFVHGGGFARGAKSTPGLPFYDNVMLWAAGEGMVGFNINYRLAPEHQWPSGIEDLSALVAWLKANAGTYGGDPGRIFLWGHSAGAAHVGDYVAHRTLRGSPPEIAGAILTSGFYALGDEVSVWQAYYGADVATYPERSSLAALARAETPLFLNDAEFDPEMFQQQTRLLAETRADAGRPVTYLHLLGHSHISETYAIGTEDRSLSDPVLAFIRSVVQ
jgi:acetyl esterase/lipase